MKTQRRLTKYLSLGAMVLVGVLLMAAGPGAIAQTGVDSGLQAKVASKLSHDPLLQGQSIMVNANGSQITLSGRVQTEKQWQEAETVAANVSGVRTILNNLTIADQSSQTPVSQPQNYGNAGDQMAPPPPPDVQQPQATPTPGSPSNAMNDAGNPPPPPPDQQGSQNPQSYGQQARPEYQGNGYQGQSYGSGYGTQNYQGYGQNGYAPPPQEPSGPVAVPAGTLLQIRTIQPLDSAHVKAGQIFDATVATDVWEGNVLAIPRGATLQGMVVEAEQPQGKLGGKARLELRVTSLTMGGQNYRLDTDVWSSVGPDKAGYTVGNTATGGLLGAIIGGVIGRGPGAAVGAGLGAMAGLGASSATKGPRIYIPSEAVLTLHLAEPVTVQPVSWEEARRLAASVPQLLTRPMYGRRYMRPYPYGYPPPYDYSPYPYWGPSYYSFGWGW